MADAVEVVAGRDLWQNGNTQTSRVQGVESGDWWSPCCWSFRVAPGQPMPAFPRRAPSGDVTLRVNR